MANNGWKKLQNKMLVLLTTSHKNVHTVQTTTCKRVRCKNQNYSKIQIAKCMRILSENDTQCVPTVTITIEIAVLTASQNTILYSAASWIELFVLHYISYNQSVTLEGSCINSMEEKDTKVHVFYITGLLANQWHI